MRTYIHSVLIFLLGFHTAARSLHATPKHPCSGKYEDQAKMITDDELSPLFLNLSEQLKFEFETLEDDVLNLAEFLFQDDDDFFMDPMVSCDQVSDSKVISGSNHSKSQNAQSVAQKKEKLVSKGLDLLDAKCSAPVTTEEELFCNEVLDDEFNA